MNKKAAYAKNSTSLGSANDSILKQGNPKSFPLKRLINSKTAKNGDKNRIGYIATDLGNNINVTEPLFLGHEFQFAGRLDTRDDRRNDIKTHVNGMNQLAQMW